MQSSRALPRAYHLASKLTKLSLVLWAQHVYWSCHKSQCIAYACPVPVAEAHCHTTVAIWHRISAACSGIHCKVFAWHDCVPFVGPTLKHASPIVASLIEAVSIHPPLLQFACNVLLSPCLLHAAVLLEHGRSLLRAGCLCNK